MKNSQCYDSFVEALEGRVLMSVPPLVPRPVTIVLEPATISPPTYPQNYRSRKGTFYAGDYYWGGDRKIKLWRATDEIVIALSPEAISGHLLRHLMAPDGPLAGFKMGSLDVGMAGPNVVHLTTSHPLGRNAFRHLRNQIARTPGVEWASPTFRDRLGYWLIATTGIEIKLKDGVDPAQFFAGKVKDYRATGVFPRATAFKGGVAALRLANQFHDCPGGVFAARLNRSHFD
jgi:hypothetical protein